MAVTEFVKIEGLKELKVALRELPDATARNVLRRVALKALRPIADAAIALAPKETGHLKRRIAVSARLSSRQRAKHQRTGDDVEVFAGAGPLPYAHMVEFGTVDTPAQPFMRPAWDSGRYKMLETIREDLFVEISKAAARIARKVARGVK